MQCVAPLLSAFAVTWERGARWLAMAKYVIRSELPCLPAWPTAKSDSPQLMVSFAVVLLQRVKVTKVSLEGSNFTLSLTNCSDYAISCYVAPDYYGIQLYFLGLNLLRENQLRQWLSVRLSKSITNALELLHSCVLNHRYAFPFSFI